MIQDMLMCKIIKKTYCAPGINSRTCYNHQHPVVFPIEYEHRPACGSERITRITLGMD